MRAKKKSTKAVWRDADDAPELTGAEISRADAEWQVGGKRVTAAKGKAAFREALLGKTRVTMHLDNAVLAHFKSLAGQRGYQTLINAALRKTVVVESDEARLRKLLREELQSVKRG